MINALTTAQNDQPAAAGLTLNEFTQFFIEIQNQPAWRARADREMDYVDGNQLDSEILRKQQEIGIPPAIEPLIGPAVDAVTGYEEKTRTDWRLSSGGGGPEGEAVSKALNFKLNQAERTSGADVACGDAFKVQYSVGLGWVEVARESDPFKPKYRAQAIHRNEIFWDMLSKDRVKLSDARYLVRRRWTDISLVKLKFPNKADVITQSWNGWMGRFELSADGGTSTGLARSWADERGNSIEEQEWLDTERQRCCLFEVWYRRWETATVFFTPDGRVVEYDPTNAAHVIAIAQGAVKPMKVIISRLYVSYWMGPHKLSDTKTPYSHNDLPYVPFWGSKEDRTGVPKGAVRGMMYLQDAVNATISKIRWGLSSMRTERTDGAVKMKDEQFRQMIARPDADIVLDPVAMSKPGAVFKVFRDFQVNEQQYKMLEDGRRGIERLSVTNAFRGSEGTATSGRQEDTQVEQSMQSLASYMSNFKTGRTQVGELLLSLIIEDTKGKPETVVIPRTPVREAMSIALNQPAVDPDTQFQYMTNDVQRIRMTVELSDVPSTPGFRSQQLAALSEAMKGMPQNLQVVALPHLLALMDIPDKEDIIADLRRAQDAATPEQIEERIQAEVDEALRQSDHALRARELDAKYSPAKMEAEVQKLIAEKVKIAVESAFSSVQGAAQLAAMPALAGVADELLKQAGWAPPTPRGVDPNLQVPGVGALPAPGAAAVPDVRENTSPGQPPVPQSPATGMNGIETMTPADNLAEQ